MLHSCVGTIHPSPVSEASGLLSASGRLTHTEAGGLLESVRMGQFLDLSGKTFGKWHVLGIGGKTKFGNYKWLCQCECGHKVVVIGGSLTSGKSISCGCSFNKGNFRHGQARVNEETSEYGIWKGIKQRCLNENCECWEYYGGRGIKMELEWQHSYEAFFRDMGNRPSRLHTIERIDNNGNYEPSNCTWATMREQCQNRRRKGTATNQQRADSDEAMAT